MRNRRYKWNCFMFYVGRAGIETEAKPLEKQGVAQKAAAKSAAVTVGGTDDVREVAAFLAKLPSDMREALIAVARAAKAP